MLHAGAQTLLNTNLNPIVSQRDRPIVVRVRADPHFADQWIIDDEIHQQSLYWSGTNTLGPVEGDSGGITALSQSMRLYVLFGGTFVAAVNQEAADVYHDVRTVLAGQVARESFVVAEWVDGIPYAAPVGGGAGTWGVVGSKVVVSDWAYDGTNLTPHVTTSITVFEWSVANSRYEPITPNPTVHCGFSVDIPCNRILWLSKNTAGIWCLPSVDTGDHRYPGT